MAEYIELIDKYLVTRGENGTDKTLYIPKRSILYFSDNGFYKGGDAE